MEGRRQSAKYLKTLAASTAGAMILFACFNWTVDPYGIRESAPRRSFNLNKVAVGPRMRFAKALAISRRRPATLLLGTSRANIGLDPESPALAGAACVYNAGINSLRPLEARAFVEHAIRVGSLRRVIYGLDFFSFNARAAHEVDFNPNLLRGTIPLKGWYDACCSLSALGDSVDTVWQNMRNGDRVEFLPNGFRRGEWYAEKYARGERDFESRLRGMIEGYLRTPTLYGDWVAETESVHPTAEFARLVALCRESGVRLDLFISPASVYQWETLDKAGLWPEWEDWKRALAHVAPVWDFSGYNAVTEREKNYWDSSHYKKEIGDAILERILTDGNGGGENFGVLVDERNIEAHLARTRRARAAFNAAHPEVRAFVDRVAEGIGFKPKDGQGSDRK